MSRGQRMRIVYIQHDVIHLRHKWSDYVVVPKLLCWKDYVWQSFNGKNNEVTNNV